MNQLAETDKKNLQKNLYKAGATSVLLMLVLFLIGAIGIITTSLRITINNGWLMQLQDNWLVVLFKINMGLQANLNIISLIDLAIMVLFCAMSLGLYHGLKKASKIWSLIATALPFLGIPTFLATSTAGRSALLIATLLFSIIMLRSNIFSKITAYVGIVASTLLFFAGDIATAIFSSSSIVAIFIAFGYVLWMLWLLFIAQKLYQLEKFIGRKAE
ncbi:MAG: hypothetical protein GWN00_35190 [Aliifodinibius sp.]|nr:hypothetical protein [Fodinibius sp.]NIV15893.1 hypothetical protein [Fodinibius sp.]NIY29845.1 hypothetical protein [Fodinibius sp.]